MGASMIALIVIVQSDRCGVKRRRWSVRKIVREILSLRLLNGRTLVRKPQANPLGGLCPRTQGDPLQIRRGFLVRSKNPQKSLAILWADVGPPRTRYGPKSKTGSLRELFKRNLLDPIQTPTNSASDFEVHLDPLRVQRRP